MKRQMKKLIVSAVALSLVIPALSAPKAEAAKKPSLVKKVSVKAGKTKKVTVKGVKTKQIKKTTWSVKSKKVVTLSKKKKNSTTDKNALNKLCTKEKQLHFFHGSPSRLNTAL